MGAKLPTIFLQGEDWPTSMIALGGQCTGAPHAFCRHSLKGVWQDLDQPHRQGCPCGWIVIHLTLLSRDEYLPLTQVGLRILTTLLNPVREKLTQPSLQGLAPRANPGSEMPFWLVPLCVTNFTM